MISSADNTAVEADNAAEADNTAAEADNAAEAVSTERHFTEQTL